MINHFKQHIPMYCSGIEKIEFNFETLEELLDNEWIKEVKETLEDRFIRFSKSVDPAKKNLEEKLMIEYKDLSNKRSWWVLGYIQIPNQLNLPEINYNE